MDGLQQSSDVRSILLWLTKPARACGIVISLNMRANANEQWQIDRARRRRQRKQYFVWSVVYAKLLVRMCVGRFFMIMIFMLIYGKLTNSAKSQWEKKKNTAWTTVDARRKTERKTNCRLRSMRCGVFVCVCGECVHVPYNIFIIAIFSLRVHLAANVV